MIEFYRINDAKKEHVLYAIEYDSYSIVFDLLHKKTGLYIDPYGSTRIYHDILKEFRINLIELDLTNNDFFKFITHVIEKGDSLISEGD